MLTSIYYLDKSDDIPFYIGKSNNIRVRSNYHKNHIGGNVRLVEIDQIPINEWKFWEKHYISLYKSWGFKLINKNDGGGGLTNRVITWGNKISKGNKGKKFSKETRQLIIKNKSKIILQYDLDGNFIKEWLGIRKTDAYFSSTNKSSSVWACVNNIQKTAYGFIWFKKKDFDEDKLKNRLELVKKKL